MQTRSIGTMHTSAKARLTSVAIRIRIRIRIRDPDRHQNLIICSLATTFHENFMQIRSEFLRNVANRQRDTQRRKYNLLGGGSNIFSVETSYKNNEIHPDRPLVMMDVVSWLQLQGNERRRLSCINK